MRVFAVLRKYLVYYDQCLVGVCVYVKCLNKMYYFNFEQLIYLASRTMGVMHHNLQHMPRALIPLSSSVQTLFKIQLKGEIMWCSLSWTYAPKLLKGGSFYFHSFNWFCLSYPVVSQFSVPNLLENPFQFLYCFVFFYFVTLFNWGIERVKRMSVERGGGSMGPLFLMNRFKVVRNINFTLRPLRKSGICMSV